MTPEQSELVKRLRMHEMRGVGPGVNEDCGEAADTIEAQAAEIARLREALRPFVEYVHDDWRKGNGRFVMVACDGKGGGWIGAEDLRRARAALSRGTND